MNKHSRISLPLLVLVLSAFASPGSAQSHLGREFWIAEPPNMGTPFSLRVTNPGPSTANVSIFNVLEGTTLSTISPGAAVTFNFPWHCVATQGATVSTDQVYRITSDRNVGVVSFSPDAPTFVDDACLGLPLQTLGQRYRLASMFTQYSLGRPLVMTVAASPGVTNVKLIDGAEVVQLNYNLNQGECLQQLWYPDMTGWEIEADKPVAVFSGNECEEVGPGCCCDLLYEQLLPETKVADRYVVAPLWTRPIGCTDASNCSPDLFRFVATVDGTTLSTTPNVGGGTLNEGDFLELVSAVPFVIQGNQPFLGYQYMIGQEVEIDSSPAPGVGDPSLLFIAPVSEYRRDFLVQVGAYTYSFLNVIAPTGTLLALDNTTVTPTWDPIGTLDGIGYQRASIPVTPGAHRLSSSNKSFTVTVSGMGNYSSYAYVGGIGVDCKPGEDGWIRDTDDDDGNEPNPSAQAMWQSPDIWVRRQQDTALQFAHQHEDPLPNQVNYVYVKLRNRGCATLAGGQVLTYFSKAATSQPWSSAWLGNPLTGDQIGSQTVTPIPFGGETVLEFPWTPPSHGAFGILARFVSANDPMYAPEVASTFTNAKQNNNVAWKNVTVLGPADISVAPGPLVAFPVAIRNFYPTALAIDLEFNPGGAPLEPSFLASGSVQLTLPPELFAAWELAGGAGTGLLHIAGTSRFELVEPVAALRGLPLAAGQEHTLVLHFSQTREERLQRRAYEPLLLLQRTAGSPQPEGGLTFHFDLPGVRHAPRKL